ncbi:MAG: hypothetical protein KKF50_03120 [Nanoarchaeota archaeon]|nr:hypothetical protein [Nanoarchaeota archaeon]
MENKTNDSAKATNVATIFAEWTLDQLRLKDINGLEEKAVGYWNSDCLRLEEGLERVKQTTSYDNATELTNLAVGLMKIYEGVPYGK